MITKKTFQIAKSIVYSFFPCQLPLRLWGIPSLMANALYFFLTFNFLFLTFNCFSQSGGAAINTTGAAANNSAMLDVSSTNQGVRIPRVALTNLTSSSPVTNPVNSLMVFDTVTFTGGTQGYYYWNTPTLSWVKLVANVSGSCGWLTNGNAGTDSTANFIGTTDSKPLVIKTGGIEKMRIMTNGNVGIGTSAPVSPLNIVGVGDIPIILNRDPSGVNYINRLGFDYVGTFSNHNFRLFSNSTVKMTINTIGNVGIGTTNPQATLDVNGTITASALKITTGAGTDKVLTSDNDGNATWQALAGGTAQTCLVPEPTLHYIDLNGQGNTLTSNTDMKVASYVIPYKITINKVSFSIAGVTTATTLKIAMYSEDGQTKLFEKESGTVVAQAVTTLTLDAPVTVNPGIYYITYLPTGTPNFGVRCWKDTGTDIYNFFNSISGEAINEGHLTVTGNTIPATFSPSALTASNNTALMIRFD
ncbi:MAG: hypothetical protein HGB12_02140 [Bacteroidetes bacterium]|nr:hypothetical protein [Bacteroidota bacterium]